MAKTEKKKKDDPGISCNGRKESYLPPNRGISKGHRSQTEKALKEQGCNNMNSKIIIVLDYNPKYFLNIEFIQK